VSGDEASERRVEIRQEPGRHTLVHKVVTRNGRKERGEGRVGGETIGKVVMDDRSATNDRNVDTHVEHASNIGRGAQIAGNTEPCFDARKVGEVFDE
jgi:hypothetical protein